MLLQSDILQILGDLSDMPTLDGLGRLCVCSESEHEDLNLLICMTLSGFPGQVSSEPFQRSSEATYTKRWMYFLS